MSFMNIKHPEKRDATIEDYLATVKRIQQHNLEERSDLIDRQRELEETYEPVVASNQKMAAEIVKNLLPIKDELKGINENLEKTGGKKRKLNAVEEEYGPLAKIFLQKYLDSKSTVDTMFCI